MNNNKAHVLPHSILTLAISISTSLLVICSFANAEYRVFRLVIKQVAKNSNPAFNSEPPQTRIVESTLDPLQYPTYYPIKMDESISYTETWMCRGRTSDFAALCPQPKN